MTSDVLGEARKATAAALKQQRDLEASRQQRGTISKSVPVNEDAFARRPNNNNRMGSVNSSRPRVQQQRVVKQVDGSQDVFV